VKDNVSLRWRHAFARWYLLNGGDLSALSDLMGHSSVEVTRQFYAVFNREELRRKHDRHSMIAR
jgi:integrase/recombinase XerD